MAQHASTGDMSFRAPRTRGWSEDWLAVVAGAAVTGTPAGCVRYSTIASRSLRASSGSRSASSSMEPLRSAKRTVTCLRSPSKAVLSPRQRTGAQFETGAAVAADQKLYLSSAMSLRVSVALGGTSPPVEMTRSA